MKVCVSARAIDPGSAGEGCAVADGVIFADGSTRVDSVGFVKFSPLRRFVQFGAVAVERPAFQGKRSLNAHPQDLMNLAWDGGQLAAVSIAPGGIYLEFTPTQWKSDIPKPVHHLRGWASLTRAEQALFPPGTLQIIRKAAEKGAAQNWKRSGVSYYPRSWTWHNKLDAILLFKFTAAHVAAKGLL